MARSDKGMVFFYDWKDTFEELPGNECKALLLAMLEYCQNDVEPPKFKGKAGIAASFIFSFLKRSKQNAQAGKKGMGKRYDSDNGVNNGVNNDDDNGDITALGNINQDKNNNINQDYKQNKNNSGVSNVADAASRFDAFWEVYPRKVGKAAAQKSWDKLCPDDALCDTILSAAEAQKRSAQWLKDGGQYIPNPATWLNQRRWEDELPEPAKQQPSAPAGSFSTEEFFEAALKRSLSACQEVRDEQVSRH